MNTRATVEAWLAGTLVDVLLAQETGQPWAAFAEKAVGAVNTPATVGTHYAGAVVNVNLAKVAQEARGAQAIVTVVARLPLLARAAVLAGLTLTLQKVQFAGVAAPSERAHALKAALPIQAGATVLARGRLALVNIDLAVGADETSFTHARVLLITVKASSPVLARIRGTLVLILAPVAAVSVGTGAGETVETVDTATAVKARALYAKAVVDVFIAVHSSETGQAGAVEAAKGVCAGGVVVAPSRVVAFVDVRLAAISTETVHTETLRCAWLAGDGNNISAHTLVFASDAQAVVNVRLAKVTLPSLLADALKPSDKVDADAAVFTRIRLAFVDLNIAQLASVADVAFAYVGLGAKPMNASPLAANGNPAVDADVPAVSTLAHVPCQQVEAGAPVLARVGAALVDLNLAMLTSPPRHASARILRI